MVLAIAWLAFGMVLVYTSPRSLVAFLIFISSALLIYYLKLSNRAKLSLAVLLAVVLLPVVGVRNIFYLEVAFQISVFAALALGLNIVVGFARLGGHAVGIVAHQPAVLAGVLDINSSERSRSFHPFLGRRYTKLRVRLSKDPQAKNQNRNSN